MDQTHIGYKSWDEPRGGNIKPTVKRITPEEAKKEVMFLMKKIE